VGIEKGTVLEVRVADRWIRARFEFRITQGEPLGYYSLYREDGGGRVVVCDCNVRELQEAAPAPIPPSVKGMLVADRRVRSQGYHPGTRR
jgi:hypothetical protein